MMPLDPVDVTVDNSATGSAPASGAGPQQRLSQLPVGIISAIVQVLAEELATLKAVPDRLAYAADIVARICAHAGDALTEQDAIDAAAIAAQIAKAKADREADLERRQAAAAQQAVADAQRDEAEKP